MSFLGFTSTRLGPCCVLHKETPAKNPENPVQLEPMTPRLRVSHFTTVLRVTLTFRKNMAAASRKVKYTVLETLGAILQENNRERYSSIFAFKDQLTLVPYITKQNKCVPALSSKHHIDNIEGDDRKSDHPALQCH